MKEPDASERSIADSLERMQREGLLTLENGRLSLTESGLFWGNNMIDEWMRLL